MLRPPQQCHHGDGLDGDYVAAEVDEAEVDQGHAQQVPQRSFRPVGRQQAADQADDEAGRFAASGTVSEALLAGLLAEPYLALPPPKSTGRDLFNAAWLERALARVDATPADVQATLAAFTARTLAHAIRTHCEGATDLFVCGGGAYNADLLRRIRVELPEMPVATTDAVGVASGHVEALAFAWLAREAIAGRSGNLPAVTGAAGPRVLGAIYPR